MRLHLRRPSVLPLALALAALAAPGTAQPASSEEARQLASIAASLVRIEQVLRSTRLSQAAELRLRRVELLQAEIAPLEEEIRSLRSSRSQQEEAIRMQRLRIEQLEEARREAELGGSEENLRQVERAHQEAEAFLQVVGEQLRDADRRREELENRLANLRSERSGWIGEIDRLIARLAAEAP